MPGPHTHAVRDFAQNERTVVHKVRNIVLHNGYYHPSYLPNNINVFACSVDGCNQHIRDLPLVVKAEVVLKKMCKPPLSDEIK